MNAILPYQTMHHLLHPLRITRDLFDDTVQTRHAFNGKVVERMGVTTENHTSADLTVVTKEGDRVTLSTRLHSEASYVTYNRWGSISGMEIDTQAERVHSNTSHEFSMVVEGDISEQEWEDIADVREKVEDIAEHFLAGNIDGAKDILTTLLYDRSISSLNASMRYEAMATVERELRGELTSPLFSFQDVIGPDYSGEPPQMAHFISRHLENLIEKLAETSKDSNGIASLPMESIENLLSDVLDALDIHNNANVARPEQPINELV